MASVKVESHATFGNVLVATREFQPGEAVVHERPLLHVPQLKPSNPLYKPLQAYFLQHHIPASVVLKMMAFVMASPTTQASVLRCFCPDTTAYADTAVVQQARAFASCLLQHPPVPEFAEWADSQGSEQQAAATTPSGQAAAAAAAAAAGAAAGQPGPEVSVQNPAAFDMLVRVWLIWVMNGHNFQMGSALFDYGSKLTHTCAGPNTMYRTATGQIAAVVETVDGTSSTSGGSLRQQQPAGGAAGDASSPAGMHIALTSIAAGDLLTTNYLGMGHKRLMSTPARQKHLQDKFLFKCTCLRCTAEVDRARGIPCPACSGPYRADDKLLQEEVALPAWQVGDSLAATPSSVAGQSSGSGSGSVGENVQAPVTGSSSGSGPSSGSCGYIYCDMAALLSGAATPWKCDACGVAAANDTADLWGRFYTKSHASIEAEMEGWVNRLDESMDTAPLVRDPTVLHQRVLGVLRLLGPRHWASWRLLLLGVELHCGAIEEAMMKVQLKQRARSRCQDTPPAAAAAPPTGAAPAETGPTAQQAAPASSTAGGGAEGDPGALIDPAAASFITQLAMWVVRYSRQLWCAVAGQFGEAEAGQVLGYHFTETSQVLLQVASSPGILPAATVTGLVDAALQLQLLVLPGLCSIMGASYNPLAQLLGTDSLAGSGGGPGVGPGVDAAAVAAAVRRQMQQRSAEESQMLSLVKELQQLGAKERV